MKQHLLTLSFVLLFLNCYSQTQIKNSNTNEPVSFATVSFGNGNGTFADDEGKFIFTKTLYKDIDSIFISSLGYKDLNLSTDNLANTLFMEPEADELKEIIVQNKPKGKPRIQKIKPVLHDDYFKCWLPTIESEIAVLFSNPEQKTKQITNVYLPVKAEASDWNKRKRASAAKRPFSTLFRLSFYENVNGTPGDPVTYEDIIIRVTEQTNNIIDVDVSEHFVYIPRGGLFVSLQVLGYTDKSGKLLPNKKYKEVKTKKGIVKVSTTFRPLLPFTHQIKEQRTFVKRIFLHNNKWIKYTKQNITNSKLISEGLTNYGIGLKLKVFEKK